MGDLHTTHWSVHTEYSIVNTTYISLHTVTFILHAEYYTLQLTHWILCTAHYTLHTEQYTIHTQYFTLHTVQDTLHATNWVQHTIYLLVSFINAINVCMALLTHALPKAYQEIMCANLCKPTVKTTGPMSRSFLISPISAWLEPSGMMLIVLAVG